MTFSRRDFVKSSVLGAVAAGVGSQAAIPEMLAESSRGSAPGSAKRPIILCAHNGYAYVEVAYAFLKSGGDTLDAAVKVVMGPENDPNDDSASAWAACPTKKVWSSLTLAACMGRLARAGSVGGVRNIKNVSLVCESRYGTHRARHAGRAKARSDSPSLMGLPRENLLTDQFAQNLAAVEGNPFRSRLVGAGHGRSCTGKPLPRLESQAAGRVVAAIASGTLQQRAADLGIPSSEFQHRGHAAV